MTPGGSPGEAQAAGLGTPASSPPPCPSRGKSPEGAEPRVKAGAAQPASGRRGKSFPSSNSNPLASGMACSVHPSALHHIQQ